MKRFIIGFVCMSALAVAYLAQAPQGKLAGLIQAGSRKAALDMIQAGADVNEAQLDGTRPIHWAVYRVDYELLDALVAKKAKANVMNELGSTPLAEAVKLSDARMVKTLLDAGSGPEGANADGETALMLAIKNGDLALAQTLVTAGANVNAVEKVQNQTPLMWAAAAARNAPEMVKLLLSKGANVKARAKFTDWPAQMTSEPRAQYHSYGGLTALLYASRGGCYACVEALVGANADVNVPNPEGVTPLMIALDDSHNDVAKFLLDHGANPKVWDVYGRTALYIAVDKKTAPPGAAGAPGGGGGGGRGGAGAGAGGRGGAAPAGAGRGAGAAGGAPARGAVGGAVGGAAGGAVGGAAGGAVGGAANVAANGAARGGAPAAAPALPPGGPAAAGAGAGRGGAANGAAGGRGGGGRGGGAPAGGGRGGAAGAGSTGPAVSSMEIINALLAAGADPNSALSARRPESGSGGRFNDPLLTTGVTPLFRATMNNDMEVIQALLDKGASPNVFVMGLTPFLLATGTDGSAVRSTVLLDLFLQHGADINTQVTGRWSYSMRLSRACTQPCTSNTSFPNIEGWTALHAASNPQSGRADMVRYLLDHGARTDLTDASGRTPLDVVNGVPFRRVPTSWGTANIPSPAGTPDVAETTPAPAAGGRGGRGGASANPEVVSEIRTLLQNAAQNPKK